MTAPDASDQTRDRLLQAALDIFAERGFKAATVREICARAGVNLSAVNYYFVSKEALYREALAYSFKVADRKYPQDALLDEALSPEDRLLVFIRSLLLRLLDDSHLGVHGKLMAREIADPTGALEHVVETVMRPRFRALRSLLPQLAGADWSPADLDRLVYSIVGQCLVYRHSRPLIERLAPETIANPAAVERTAELIYQFSLAALRQMGQQQTVRP